MNPPGPFDSLQAPPPPPAYTPEPAAAPQPSIPQPQIPMTAATANEGGTITVTATAVMPQASVPAFRGDLLPDGNYAATAGDPPKDAHGWALTRFYIWKFGGTLFMERSASGEYVMSRSALPFFICLILSMFIWKSGVDIPATLERLQFGLLGVMFGDRGLAIVQQLVTAKHGDPYAGRS